MGDSHQLPGCWAYVYVRPTRRTRKTTGTHRDGALDTAGTRTRGAGMVARLKQKEMAAQACARTREKRIAAERKQHQHLGGSISPRDTPETLALASADSMLAASASAGNGNCAHYYEHAHACVFPSSLLFYLHAPCVPEYLKSESRA